jgi:YVTN family beta-propeller protein
VVAGKEKDPMAVDIRLPRGYWREIRRAPQARAVSPRILACLVLGGLALSSTGLIRSSLSLSATQASFAGSAAAAVAAVQDSPANPNSGPIAISPDDRYVWMTSPDDNLVAVVKIEGDANQLVKQISVGREPNCLAISPGNNAVYVTNSVDGTVSVITFPPGDPTQARVSATVPVGTEPFGVLVTPDGAKVYVANSNSGDVTVLRTADNTVIRTIPNVGYQPHGLAFNNGRLYVTQLLAQLRDNGRAVERNEGEDDGKEGRITVINTATDTVEQTLVLNPLTPAQVGFKSSGSTLDRIPIHNNAQNQLVTDFDTACFPNLIWSMGIKNGRAYVPAVGASPNGPFRFNVNCQSVLSVVNLATATEEGRKTINMNKGLAAERVGTKLFLSNPVAVAFKRNANEGYVIAQGIDQVVKVNLAADGSPSIGAPTPVRISTTQDPNGDFTKRGKMPMGIVINATDTRAYVACVLSKDVAVLDLVNNKLLANVVAGNLPVRNSVAGIVLRGKQLFHSSIGPAGTKENSTTPAGRMSDFGWGNCASCHPKGLADGVTWMFPDGPRQTIPLNSTFDRIPRVSGNQINLDRARILNWSAVRDEVQDFELNTRAVFGGEGLIRDGRAVINLINADGTGEANTNRDPDLDALAAYQALGIRTPVAPPLPRADFFQALQLFEEAGCVKCHNGRLWSNSIRDFIPPPRSERAGDSRQITDGQLAFFLKPVGTFDGTLFNEVRSNVPDAVPPGRGVLGFNPPSLLGLSASAPYFHSGQALTLDEVMNAVPHRRSGLPTGAADPFDDTANAAVMARFLRSLDEKTPFFPGP